jgi:very-short-patch-repair endonuclease
VHIDRIIHQLAAPQHGAFSRTQARGAGITRQMLAVRIRNGSLHPITGEVLVIAGSAATGRRRAISAVLDTRGVAGLSHGSAAWFWALPGFRLDPMHVTAVRRSRTSTSALACVHTTTALPDAHLCVVDGLCVTVPVRVLFDLAGDVHPERLARVIDAAWRKRYLTGRLLRRTLAELAERGRPGIQIMRQLIDERGDGYRPTDSNLEARFLALMLEIGIDSLERQNDLGGRDWLGRVDFYDRDLRLILEIDRALHHTSLSDRAHDERRRAELQAAGFTVVVIAEFDVWHRPREVQRRVRRLRHRMRATALPVPDPTP